MKRGAKSVQIRPLHSMATRHHVTNVKGISQIIVLHFCCAVVSIHSCENRCQFQTHEFEHFSMTLCHQLCRCDHFSPCFPSCCFHACQIVCNFVLNSNWLSSLVQFTPSNVSTTGWKANGGLKEKRKSMQSASSPDAVVMKHNGCESQSVV